MRILTTYPAADGFRMPGEFEPHDGCIMIWPKRPGSWNYGAIKAREAFKRVAFAIAESEPVYMLAEPDVAENAREMLGVADAAENVKEMPGKSGTAGNAGETPGVSGVSQDAGEMPGKSGAARRNIRVIEMESDDAWARDVAPTFVVNGAGVIRGIDWEFNAWGGETDGLYAHWDKDDRVAASVCEALGYDCYDAHPFVLEGGSIHSDGEGTVLVTEACLLSAGRNPNLTKGQIEENLKRYLGAEKVIWLERGIYNDETNEHVDNICAFVKPGEVVLAWTDDKNDPQYELSAGCLRTLESERDARGRRIRVHKLPIPKEPIRITEEDLGGYEFEEGEDTREVGERLAASYVNFYLSNEGIIIPQFGDENDRTAVAVLSGLFPERKAYPVPARDILLGGGNIHCITQQIPAAGPPRPVPAADTRDRFPMAGPRGWSERRQKCVK